MTPIPSPRQEAVGALAATAERGVAKYKVRESPPYAERQKALSSIPEALAYLHAVRSALSCGLKIPKPFRDHALVGRLAGFRSVIVGEIENSDVTFVLIYRIRRGLLDLMYLDQHDDAYETFRRLP